MNDNRRATRLFLKALSPNDAYKYIRSFNLPVKHEKLLLALYVKKLSMFQAIWHLEDECRICLSWRTALRIHKQGLDWITKSVS